MLSTEKIIEIADQHSTPLYILDKEALENRINEIKAILGEGVTLCYAMKANPFFVDVYKRQVTLLMEGNDYIKIADQLGKTPKSIDNAIQLSLIHICLSLQ